MPSARLILAFVLAFSTTLAQKKPVTIDSITSAPPRGGPGPIQWAPDGKRFAYEEGEKLWLYDATSKSKKEIATLSDLTAKAVKTPEPELTDWQNRRVSEQSFAWSHTGKELLIATGGDLFILHVDSGKWDQLTATAEAERDPKLSPDDRYVSFRKGHDLYALEIATRIVTRLTTDGSDTVWNAELDWVYPEGLELGTAHWWSPDSKRIAYLQFDVSREPLFPQVDLLGTRAKLEPERFPQPGDPNADVRVGIVPVGGGSTRWMDLGETRGHLIARLDWTPESHAVAVQRLNRVQNQLDLMLADAETGTARTLLHEDDPYWINVADDFRFLTGSQRFLWASERSGFRHIYMYSRDGKLLNPVTSGDWEVTGIAGVDESAGELYYTSTEESPLERHLYATQLDGSGPRRLTQAKGTHAISMSPTTEFYLDSHSSSTSPPQKTLYSKNAAQVAVFHEADRSQIETYDLLPAEIVKLKAADGETLYGRLIKPAGFNPGKKYPVIVMIYGGPNVQTVRDSWSGANFDQALAHRGFIIWELDNHGSSGRGHKWESAIFRNMGEHELEDQLIGVRYLESLKFADTSRMGIHGWSYGGYMTLYTLTHAPKSFAAGIAGAPVTNWRNYDSIYTERYMGLPDENADGYERSSPANKANDITAKLLLIHNTEDDNVHFQNTMQMIVALERAGKHFDLMVYPQKQHGVTGKARKHLYETMAEFFEKNLK